MAKIPLSAEQKCLHKKLLPSNIVMCIVALLAAVAMILLPWFDLRVRIQGDKVADLLPEQQSGEQASGDDMTDSLVEALQGNEIDIVVNIHPIKMAMAVIGGDKEMESFMDSLIGKEGAAVFAQDLATMIIPAFIEGVVHTTIDSLVDEALQTAGKDKTPELQAQVATYKDEATEAVEILVGKATTPSNPTEAKTKFNKLVDDMAAEQLADHNVTLDAAALKDTFGEIIDLGTNDDGEFEVIHLLGNLEQLGQEEGGADNTQMQDIQAILDIIENPSAVLMEKLGNNKSTVKLVVLGVFLLFVAIPAFFWLHLAIAAFVRIFTAKKTAVTWYAKFFGFWAGFGVVLLDAIILLLPLVQSWLNIAMLAPVADALGAMTIYFHGSGTVTAVCWLIIVIIGWCGYKRTAKIWRRVKKCTKKADKMGLDVQTYFEQEDKKVRRKAEKRGLATSDYVQMRKDKLGIHVEETNKVTYWSELKSDGETSAPTQTDYVEETPFAAENAATEAYAQAPAEMPEEEATQVVAEEKDTFEGLEGTVYLPDDMKADAPVQESAPVEESVAETTPVVEEKPVAEESAPVEEAPVVEVPVIEESAPVEEKVEETPKAAKKPAAKKPAAKKPTAEKTEEVSAEEKKATPKKAATKTAEEKKPATKKATPKSTTTTTTTTKKTPNATTTTTTKTTKKATSNSTTTTKTTTKTTKTPNSTTTTKTTTTTTTPKKKSTSQKSSTSKRKSVPVVDEEMLNEIKD